MHRTHSKSVLAGTALATMALTFSSIGVIAGDAEGIPNTPTGYTELDLALGEDKPYDGTKVVVQSQWIEGEGVSFRNSLAPFEAATGIDIQFAEVPSGFHETQVNVALNGGNAADILQLAQPASIIAYGADGLIQEIGGILGNTEKAAAEMPALGAYIDADGNIYGFPWKAAVKSLVWYPIKAFEAAGYEVPTTWDEMVALSDQIVADGSNPWCIGIESGSATGWLATDWVENVLLRTASADAYNAWIAGELPFSSPEVKRAFDIVGQIFFSPDYAYGGSTYINSTWVGEPMDPMFDDDLQNPGCWMHQIADWYGPDFFIDYDNETQTSKYIVGEDIGLFYLPPIDEEFGNAVLGSGDAFVVTSDRDEVKAVAQMLATPESQEAWIKAGGALSANSTVPIEWYEGNYEAEVMADIIANASTFSFDASDVMPPSVGGGSFWNETVNWISANGENTEAVLQAIDDSWPAE